MRAGGACTRSSMRLVRPVSHAAQWHARGCRKRATGQQVACTERTLDSWKPIYAVRMQLMAACT